MSMVSYAQNREDVLLARLFPSLRSLDLSYNMLTSAALTRDALAELILATSTSNDNTSTNTENDNEHDSPPPPPPHTGLRQLRLRGNKLTDLDGFTALAEAFKGHRDVPGWKVEELDLRDNEIGRLPPELGLLPMDVFLVDGNTYVFAFLCLLLEVERMLDADVCFLSSL